jgi:hypothetical protein
MSYVEEKIGDISMIVLAMLISFTFVLLLSFLVDMLYL